jgi:outer membrane receptor protein involved in Fe transport
VGFSYPITDQGIIHFCYGHFFAMPNLDLLYRSPDYKFSQSGGLSAFGNPGLKPERTIQYEIGLQQQLSRDIGFDVTLFYKDIRDWVGAGPKLETYLPSITYALMENKDYANVRGVTFSLTKRHSNRFSAAVDYTFQYAEGTYTDPFDSYNALVNNQERRLSLIPLNYDQRHTLNGNVNFSAGTWSLTLLGQLHTGNPYTPTAQRGQSLGTGIKENSEYTPLIKNVDLYVNKFFNAGGLRMALFAKVYNLLDIRNAYGVYTDTGSPDYTTTVDVARVPYSAARVGTVEEQIRNPYNFAGPRRLQVGLSVGL